MYENSDLFLHQGFTFLLQSAKCIFPLANKIHAVCHSVPLSVSLHFFFKRFYPNYITHGFHIQKKTDYFAFIQIVIIKLRITTHSPSMNNEREREMRFPALFNLNNCCVAQDYLFLQSTRFTFWLSFFLLHYLLSRLTPMRRFIDSNAKIANWNH